MNRRAPKHAKKSAIDAGSYPLRQLLANIVTSSGEAIYSRDLNGQVTSWNKSAERIFGYSAEQIIGQPSQILLPQDRSKETDEIMKRVRRGQHIEQLETVRKHQNGRCIPVSLSVSPICNSRGRIIGASTIARDLTVERQLEAEILEISERERQRMGREIHDGLGQHLSGMELVCRTLEKSLAKQGNPEAKVAGELVCHVQQAIQQTRALARGLLPVLEVPNGLMLALEDLSRLTQSLFQVKCSFRCVEPVLLPLHSAAVHLFRITQEAITNAIRHSKTRRIDVTLRQRGANVIVEVRDFGRGWPENPASNGLGIRIMRYRAQVLGASLEIGTARPRGTRVVCSAPMQE